MTKDESPTLGTETAHVLKTKDLGGRTEVRPRAQELVKNNVEEKVKESNHNMGKANPDQEEMNLFKMNFTICSLPCLSLIVSDIMD